MDSNACVIYVHLLDEGTATMRPTQGMPLGDDVYQVLATPDYDPQDEHWQFLPGSIVRCIRVKKDGEEILVAHEAMQGVGSSDQEARADG